MNVVARRIRATPGRAALDAWHVIVDLLAPEEGGARNELLSVEGIASSLISTESPKDSPFVVSGNGPRVRLYCLYDEDAISNDAANEAALPECPTDGDWVMSFPADSDDVDWVRAGLAKKSSRLTVRDKSEPVDTTQKTSNQATDTSPEINMEAFLRP